MYSGWKRGRLSNEWVDKTKGFLDHAFSIPELVESDTIRCPCFICRSYFRHKRPRIELHLCHNGSKENYQTWTTHGERQGNQNLEISSGVEHDGFGETHRMDAMLVDLAGEHPPLVDETPTGFAEAFYRMVVVQMSKYMSKPCTLGALLLLVYWPLNCSTIFQWHVMMIIWNSLLNSSLLVLRFLRTSTVLKTRGPWYAIP
jgi:hypothetical protein